MGKSTKSVVVLWQRRPFQKIYGRLIRAFRVAEMNKKEYKSEIGRPIVIISSSNSVIFFLNRDDIFLLKEPKCGRKGYFGIVN